MTDWTISYTMRANGRDVNHGDELTITGEGRFRFLKHVVTPTGIEWIDVFGGKKGHENLRSFRPHQIRTVHRDRRLRAGVKR